MTNKQELTTLASIAKIDQWFRQYEAVLKARLVP